ncbi:sulfur carrier protein ThiS [Kribbella sandramycini]|uniref:Sulfur carrier protein n=1 Tax=Kribbella sandramycini TaxID=60450 RepID=A0A7Y4L2A3_9ACTN|nr:sulfur carrier protein ThiS [Kribbella sandramycini]MBB6566307.1 sulfur carrier protein [Kribbella sandramycini]NOL43030.1 sulfur carrier protein ThiS [Kribbella sandramycini]
MADESVWVNGTATSGGAGRSVAELVEEVSDRQTGIAVAVNQSVLTRAEWARTILAAGDRVEIVGAVQGG